MKNLNNKNGSLTFYGLSCGYVERESSTTKWKELYIEHNTIHVRFGRRELGWDVWESFENNQLTLARKFYKSITL